MPFDLGVAVAKIQIEELSKIINNIPHMQREEFCNEVIEFVERMKAKHTPEYYKLKKSPEDIEDFINKYDNF
jgi:hypothetical protein